MPASSATVEPVSVLVPTIGRPEQLADCLRSLAACSPRAAEIVVVDQSDGAEVAALVELHATAGARRVVSRPPGLGRAMNEGLRAARHDIVLTTHDDCTAGPEWVATAARLARATRGGIVTGRVLPAGGSAHVPSCQTDPRRRDWTGRLRTDKLYPACAVLWRGPVLELGGFDERFLSAAEDNDLCYRWLRAGRTLRYEPELAVVHHDWRSPEELVALYRRYAHASGLLYAKHLRRGDLRVLVFVARDALLGALGQARAALRRGDARATDWKLGVLHGLPRGLRDGWRL